jgi:hypothetical protein
VGPTTVGANDRERERWPVAGPTDGCHGPAGLGPA